MFRKILSVVTLLLLAVVIWAARAEILEAVHYLGSANIFFILLLIPEQLFMYFCLGQVFFSYMSAKPKVAKAKPTTPKPAETKSTEPSKAQKSPSLLTLMRISFELNFVNHAVPSGGFSGLGYITWRLRPFGATAGQVSFMYLLRYMITVCANQLQTIVAIIALVIMGGLTAPAKIVIALTALMCAGIIALIAAIIIVASSKKRIDWCARLVTKVGNWLAKVFTFGHAKSPLKLATVQKYFTDAHEDLLVARKNKKILIKPCLWGIVYSFFEIATYWLVGISMGHPELLPAIMVSEATASLVGNLFVTPGGVGGYEGSMIGIMAALGVDLALATSVVVTTRVIVLVGTITSGYGFYQHAISKIGVKEQQKIEREITNG